MFIKNEHLSYHYININISAKAICTSQSINNVIHAEGPLRHRCGTCGFKQQHVLSHVDTDDMLSVTFHACSNFQCG